MAWVVVSWPIYLKLRSSFIGQPTSELGVEIVFERVLFTFGTPK